MANNAVRLNRRRDFPCSRHEVTIRIETMLNAEITRLIRDHSAGMVATVNDDGTPSVSPKATFVVVDETTLAFGNIRSPHTLANIRKRPSVEVCFIDVVLRKAVRVTGTATLCKKTDADRALLASFQSAYAPYLPHVTGFVMVDVTAAELIFSPAYDAGFTAEELRRTNLEKLNAL